MSKNKTKRARRESKRDESRKHHRKPPQTTTATTTTKPSTPSNKPPPPTKPPQASQKPPIPFGPYDKILLVGEGDFSFTRSLAIDHGCAHVTGTSLDTAEQVCAKYASTFERVREELGALAPPVPLFHGVDAGRVSGYKELRAPVGVEGDGEGGERGGGRGEGWDVVAFMFPHTGGLSTDVNRQVRANQALLLGFFEACLGVDRRKRVGEGKGEDKGREEEGGRRQRGRREFLRTGGRIIVTLFEGEPYTLWNVRDVARHVGLKVLESFKFDWSDYPGYKHVRTLGAIEGGGAWKGEDREARMYIFEKIPLEPDGNQEKAKKNKKKGKKRPREESESEED